MVALLVPPKGRVNNMSDDEKPWTMSVPAAGKKYWGLSRNGSYDAADRGDIPTIRVGKLRRALVRPIEKKLAAAADNQD
jgi:hypothetical protein